MFKVQRAPKPSKPPKPVESDTARDLRESGQLMYTIDEACEVLSYSRRSLYNAMNGKLGPKLQSMRIGTMRRISRSQLLEYTAACERLARRQGGVV